MTICPVCKNKSNSVGPKVLWNTKTKDKDQRGSDTYLQKVMCEDCNQKYKNGELTLEDLRNV